MSGERQEEKPYNYLDEYRTDSFAERYMLEPVVLNENNICQVEMLEEVRGWDQSVIDGYAGKATGMRNHISFHKFLVKCPKHGEFFQLIEDDPRPWSYNCRHCITDEINRVGSERYVRDSAFWKSRREVRR